MTTTAKHLTIKKYKNASCKTNKIMLASLLTLCLTFTPVSWAEDWVELDGSEEAPVVVKPKKIVKKSTESGNSYKQVNQDENHDGWEEVGSDIVDLPRPKVKSKSSTVAQDDEWEVVSDVPKRRSTARTNQISVIDNRTGKDILDYDDLDKEEAYYERMEDLMIEQLGESEAQLAAIAKEAHSKKNQLVEYTSVRNDNQKTNTHQTIKTQVLPPYNLSKLGLFLQFGFMVFLTFMAVKGLLLILTSKKKHKSNRRKPKIEANFGRKVELK